MSCKSYLFIFSLQQKIKIYFVTFGPFKIPTRSNLLLETVETTLKVKNQTLKSFTTLYNDN